MRNEYKILLTMKNIFTGKPDKYYLVSYKTDAKGDVFCKYVHDGLPYRAHCYRTYNTAFSAAKKVVEKDFRVLKATVMNNGFECITISKE